KPRAAIESASGKGSDGDGDEAASTTARREPGGEPHGGVPRPGTVGRDENFHAVSVGPADGKSNDLFASFRADADGADNFCARRSGMFASRAIGAERYPREVRAGDGPSVAG